MLITDPIADMLIRIKNATLREQRSVNLPVSRIKRQIADILVKEGYLEKVEVADDDEKTGKQTVQPELKLILKYMGKKPAINGVERVSKPGQRVYIGYKDVPRVKNGLGIGIISTSKGLMTGKEAKLAKAGGELLCYIW